MKSIRVAGRLLSLVNLNLKTFAVFAWVAFGFAACAMPAEAQSANRWDKRGQAAELREDYDAAFEAYRIAHQKNPKDLRYKAHYERMRFEAGAAHVDRGRVLRQSGDTVNALAEFTRALQIDPGNETAAQEIQLTQHPQGAASTDTGPVIPGVAERTKDQTDTLRDIGQVTGPVALQPMSSDPLTYHAVEDVKNIYMAIGKIAGLNVLFDPQFKTSRIPVDLTNVSLYDALHIVGTLAGTVYKAVTPNTIFVYEVSKRATMDELAVQTFFITNASQANDLNEIVTAIRNMLDPTVKVFSIPSQNAIVMRATTDQLLLTQKLLNDLDRAKPEVVVDVAILEVNKDKVRKLGITLPQQFGLTPQVSSTTTTGTTTTGTTGTTSSTTSGLTLNTLANLNATNFAVTVSGGTVDALLTDADTRILQNPRIRATDGQAATLKIGTKIPVATGSFSAGATAGVGAGLGIQTQFTYVDVGVNIAMTPTVHLDRDVSLKMKIEVSTHNGDQIISGVTEPIIGQRVIEQTIQLREGEPSILAGILTKQDNRNLSGTPGLAEIPFLKYFFGSNFKETQQDEVIFLLIPHIVRESVLSRINTRPIDTGTQGSTELRRDPTLVEAAPMAAGGVAGAKPGTPTTAANAASAMVQQMKQQALPPAPPAAVGAETARPAALPGGGPPVTFTVMPATSTQTVGSTFQVAVILTNAHDVFSVPLQMQFDPKVLELVNVDAGDFLSRDGQSVALVHRDEGNGLVTISSSRPPGVFGMDGQGNVCTLTFKAIAAGDANLALVKVGAKTSNQTSLPALGSQAVVHVK